MKKIFTLLLVFTTLFSFSQSTTLVISQVYGAGGNSGAVYNADYVELHNISAVSQSLTGLSIQYSSATNMGDFSGVSALPSVSIPAGGYYLIQMSATGTGGVALPTPDYISTPTIAMSASSAKVALASVTTALTGCPTANVIDLVGYGTSNCSETAPTPVLSVTMAAFRNNNGCEETNNNLSNFTLAAPLPRNAATPVFICSGGPPSPSLTAAPTTLAFGNIVVATNSASQTFNLSGSNLTGAPGLIVVTSPSADFEVSNDNSSWSSSTSIPYATATLAATPVYVRFTPQSPGLKSGNVTVTGGGTTAAVNVAVNGTGIAAAGPSVVATTLNDFGDVCLNLTVGPNSFNVSGTNLTAADITIASPFTNYTFSLTSGGVYTPSLTITHPAGILAATPVFVNFAPTAVSSYNGNITINGGGLAAVVNVPVTGAGVNGTANITTGGASAITTTTATLKGNLIGVGCSLVTAYGFEYSLTSGFLTGTVVPSSNLAGTVFTANVAGLLPGTTYYYKAFATNAGGTVYGVELSFMTASLPPASLSVTTITGFGTPCLDSIAGPNSFDVSAVNLTAADIHVGPLSGYLFSATSAGPYSDSLVITQAGGTFNQTVYVIFQPTGDSAYNGNIAVTGGGATAAIVPVTGAGINSTGTVLTGDSAIITSNRVTARGSVLDIGCSLITSYGIEYSGVDGFVNGSGTKIPSINLNNNDFSSELSGLVQSTIYYYKAYVVNNGGISYGSQRSFITPPILSGLTIYDVPVIRGGNLHFSLSGIRPGHYQARIINSTGQVVFQKDMIIQVKFIDDIFILPGQLPIGVYTLQVRDLNFKIQKAFMIH